MAVQSVPYVDLAAQHAPLRQELLDAVGRVIDHGQFILGPEVEQFEAAFAALCGSRHAVAVASGTDALVLALRALRIGPGDEVITAPNSFVASASAIALVGARPVFVDVRDDYNLDPELIPDAVTPRTRAILPVHLTGRPAAMERICEIASRHGLAVVEDCAQAVLAELGGRQVGTFGDIGCFSLHPLKTLNAMGDAGVLTTDDDETAHQLRLLRNLGLEERDDAVLWSANSRLDSIQAATLLVKLRYARGWTNARRRNAVMYRNGLAGIEGVVVPSERPEEFSVYHTFVIQAEDRDGLRNHLSAAGIGTAVHYPVPIHLQTVARSLGYGSGDFPEAERQADRIVSLPVYPELTTAQLDRVTAEIRAFVAARAGRGAVAR
jgi:dTDP-4-amino-4,6-dideoxygalactose transaminase